MSSGVKAVKGLCVLLVITKFIVSACLDSLKSSENYEIEPSSQSGTSFINISISSCVGSSCCSNLGPTSPQGTLVHNELPSWFIMYGLEYNTGECLLPHLSR